MIFLSTLIFLTYCGEQDDQIRILEELLDKYCKSAGRNNNMLLGIIMVTGQSLVMDHVSATKESKQSGKAYSQL